MSIDPRVAELPGFVLLRDKLPRLHDEIDRLVASSAFGVRPNGPALDQMAGFIEPAELGARLTDDLRTGLGIRVTVEVGEPGSLPRFDHKARRVKDERTEVPF